MKNRSLLLTSVVGCSFLLTSVVSAAYFTDVPDGHPFQTPVEALSELHVVTGNPDGTFAPERPVNRAEMLKMLYLAMQMIPEGNTLCFSDVVRGSWYEPYVCDAFVRNYVKGYADGLFRPQNTITGVEAMKMIATVFGLSIPAGTTVEYGDIPADAWYRPYLGIALANKIYPIGNQAQTGFPREAAVKRGEAAAYILNAIKARRAASSVSSSVSSSSSAASSLSSSSISSSSSSSNFSVEKAYPFTAAATADGVHPQQYRFTLSTPSVVGTTVLLQSPTGSLACKIFRIADQGFSTEFYVGFRESGNCYLKTALTAGNYQLEVSSPDAGAQFTLESSDTVGDGNDGLSQAIPLTVGLAQTTSLRANDLQNWFSFTVAKETAMELAVTSVVTPTCQIYPMPDVSFTTETMPACNVRYTYPPGTYYVAVGRGALARSQKQMFSILLQ